MYAPVGIHKSAAGGGGETRVNDGLCDDMS